MDQSGIRYPVVVRFEKVSAGQAGARPGRHQLQRTRADLARAACCVHAVVERKPDAQTSVSRHVAPLALACPTCLQVNYAGVSTNNYALDEVEEVKK